MGYLGEPVHDWLTCVVLLDLRRLLIAREPPGPVASWRREKRTWLAEKTSDTGQWLSQARPGRNHREQRSVLGSKQGSEGGTWTVKATGQDGWEAILGLAIGGCVGQGPGLWELGVLTE